MFDRLEVSPVAGPHAGQTVLCVRPGERARGALVLLHGRHATAEGMVPIATALEVSDWLVVAPQATGGTWYPESFLAPIEKNEPHLTSALDLVESTISAVAKEEEIEPGRIVLLGFSQGACLALEYAARTGHHLGGVIGLSGGLIGPPGTEFDFTGIKDGLRVFLGCSDVDSHIPLERVRETEEVFRRMGAAVTARIYPGMGHTITADELYESRSVLQAVEAGS